MNSPSIVSGASKDTDQFALNEVVGRPRSAKIVRGDVSPPLVAGRLPDTVGGVFHPPADRGGRGVDSRLAVADATLPGELVNVVLYVV